MRSWAAIATVLYLPLLAGGIASPDTLAWNKLYFFADKFIITALLLIVASYEYRVEAKWLMRLTIIPQVLIVAWMLIDWNETLRNEAVVYMILCAIIVLTPLLAYYSNERRYERKDYHTDSQ